MFGSSLHEKVLCPFVWFLVVVVVDPQINWLSAVVCSFLCFCKGIHIFYRFGVLKTPRTWTTVLDLGPLTALGTTTLSSGGILEPHVVSGEVVVHELGGRRTLPLHRRNRLSIRFRFLFIDLVDNLGPFLQLDFGNLVTRKLKREIKVK